MKKSNLIKSIIILLIVCLGMSACVSDISESSNYISRAELPTEALKDLDFWEKYSDISSSHIDYGFAYVENKKGEPIQNLRCYNEGEFVTEEMTEVGKHSFLSMPGGLIPVALLYDDESVYITIVNENAEGFVYKNIEIDREKLSNGEIYKIIWEYETPEESVLKSENYVVFNICAEIDVSRFTFSVLPYEEIELSDEETSPAIGGMSFENPIFASPVESESYPQIGTPIQISNLQYIGTSDKVFVKSFDDLETDKIKVTITEMDESLIMVANKKSWEFIFDKGNDEYAIIIE